MNALPEQTLLSGNEPEPTDQPRQSPTERLDSWKEIAAYFRRDVRTVRRWEQSLGLPVHRQRHNRGVGVYAYKREVDAWWKQRDTAAAELPAQGPQTRRGAPPGWVPGFVFVALLAAVGLLQPGAWRAASLDPPPDFGAAPASGGNSSIVEYPSLSPDAQQVAFSWNGGSPGNLDIYIKAFDRVLRDLIRVTSDPAADFNPTWSPDGRSIAFVRQPAPGQFQVMLIPAEGGQERRVATCQAAWDRGAGSYLAWTPDGRGLMILQRESHEQAAGLLLLSPANGGARRLVLPLDGSRLWGKEPGMGSGPCIAAG